MTSTPLDLLHEKRLEQGLPDPAAGAAANRRLVLKGSLIGAALLLSSVAITSLLWVRQQLLRAELARPAYRCELIALGANTDPYQPVEREQRITRGILEVLAEHRHPVGIVTKSALVLRDLDILARMAERNLVKVALSVTTLDPKLARTMEPRAATPGRRLEALRQLSAAGVPTTAMVASAAKRPIIFPLR